MTALSNAAPEVRVMIVDDSALMRKLLTQLLARGENVRVVDTAMDGQFALDHLAKIRPDVVLMDVDMPRMDGLAALDRIVADYKIPVVMCSAKTTSGAAAALDALDRGAVDIIAKPSLEALTSGSAAAEIVTKVRNAAGARVRVPTARRAATPAPADRPPAGVEVPQRVSLSKVSRPEVVAIGISTGGPPALEHVLCAIQRDYPAGILIVQHMPEGFTQMLASRLDGLSQLTVREAAEGDPVLPGHVLIAPGGAHMRIRRTSDRRLVVAIDRESPAVSGHRPSVDVLFKSVAEVMGGRALGFVMTGMGSDGADGAALMRDRGAPIFAQTVDSCVCYGMPKSVLDRGIARAAVPLAQIAQTLTDIGRAPETF